MMEPETMLEFLKAAGYCAVAALLAPYFWSVFRWAVVDPADALLHKLKQLPPLTRILAISVLCISIVFGDKPSTNGTDSADAPLLGGARMTMRSARPRSSSVRRLCVSSLPFSEIDEDAVARGWRVSSVVTNENVTIVPESAVRCERWHRTGGASKFDFLKLPDWLFPFGTNLHDSVAVFNDGSLAIDFGPGCPRLAATPDPVYPVPFSSEFLTWGDARTMTFLWKDYSLCSTDATARVDVRIDLHAGGDFVVSTNCVSWLCRRIETFDWDGDGSPNDVDVEPLVPNGDGFGPHQVLPLGADTNAYYWVDVVSPFEDALVAFIGDAPSNLPDPRFVAKAGDTNRVVLLIGKYYSVESTRPLGFVGSETDGVVGSYGYGGISVCWPVFAEADEVGRDFTMSVIPSRVVGEFVWDESCCRISGAGRSFSFACNGACLCTGCLAEGEFRYEGYSIPVCGGWCPCERGPNPPFPEPEGEGGPYAASVSLSLSAPVVIFEDAYTNRPGEVVSRRSTATRLSGVAHGGPNGGTLSLSVTNGTKVTLTRGVPITSPIAVPPGQKLEFAAEYEGVAASASEGDVVFTATFTENGVGSNFTASAALTSCRLETIAIDKAIPFPCRKVVGVAEEVQVKISPDCCRVTPVSASDMAYNPASRRYKARSSAGIDRLCVNSNGSSFDLEFDVCEPLNVAALSVKAGGILAEPVASSAGEFWAVLKLCVFPTNVSFRALQFSEVGRMSEDIQGYFTNSFCQSWWHHGENENGADKWFQLVEGNRTYDIIAMPPLPQPWGDGGAFSWPIPIVWRIGDESATTNELLKRASYDQRFELDADGTSRIIKHECLVQRKRGDLWNDEDYFICQGGIGDYDE